MRIGLFLDDFDFVLQVSETGNAAQQRNCGPCSELCRGVQGLMGIASLHPSYKNSIEQS
jgi:hypothetical protein